MIFENYSYKKGRREYQSGSEKYVKRGRLGKRKGCLICFSLHKLNTGVYIVLCKKSLAFF